MMGKPNIGSGRGTRLRALDEQTLVPPKRVFFQYSSIPPFHYSFSKLLDRLFPLCGREGLPTCHSPTKQLG